jgi:hypothetical protein
MEVVSSAERAMISARFFRLIQNGLDGYIHTQVDHPKPRL